ncbi:Nicotinate-nucleotide pyrophosphorylase [Mycena kentingensis (nom. inval.)]|nr:Nicotinate-nucleotide pyrophosphorylase [Mycena kentingensis (nom. inval.)]
MFKFALVAVALAASARAYSVTSPTSQTNFTTDADNIVRWTFVSTDRQNFTIVLSQGGDPNSQQVLKALVDREDGETTVGAPATGWPASGSGPYTINLCQDSENLNSILAQSQQFYFEAPKVSSTSSSAISTTLSTPVTLQPTTPNTVQPTATTGNADATPTDSAESQTPSGGATSASPGMKIGLGLRVFLDSHYYTRTRTPYRTPMPNSYAHLLPPSWKPQVTAWLAEDTPSFDYGGYVVGEAEREARLFGKGSVPAVLAGSPFFTEVFEQLGCKVVWHIEEGSTFEPVKHVATVTGKARHLLLGERVALNLLARCSGIATKSKRIKDLARGYGFNGIVAGTRKTTPGFRLVEKYGMLVGGIDPHRHDLSSMIMLKDNHIWSSGSITAAIQQARAVGGFSLLLDVEVQSEVEADEAIEAGADVIMLDNLEGEELVSVARNLRRKWSGKRKFLLETSGNITEANLQERASNEVDILSTSTVHQSVQHIDFSLKIQKPQ